MLFGKFRSLGRLGRLGVLGATAAPFIIGAASCESNRGVYLWGDNSHGLIGPVRSRAVRVPTRVPFFDNKDVKSVAVSPQFAVAVLANGSAVQWTSPTNIEPVKGVSGIAKILISSTSHNAVSLGKNGQIHAWQLGSSPQQVTVPKLGWFEKVVDVACGVDHIVALTNKGRVLTGFLDNAAASHHGQLGIAAFPHFEPIPAPLELHQVKLIDGPVKQIACGNYHTLLLTDRGELWGCGSNQFGQLMLPYTFKNTKVNVPVKLRESVSAVAAGSSISLFQTEEKSWFVAGNGEFGQFGTGSFAQCQLSPLRITALDSLREYDEVLKAVVPVNIHKWSVGSTHLFACMDNRASDWLVWGSNEKGQLGNNKLSKIIKPTPVMGHGRFVAGDKISACF